MSGCMNSIVTGRGYGKTLTTQAALYARLEKDLVDNGFETVWEVGPRLSKDAPSGTRLTMDTHEALDGTRTVDSVRLVRDSDAVHRVVRGFDLHSFDNEDGSITESVNPHLTTITGAMWHAARFRKESVKGEEGMIRAPMSGNGVGSEGEMRGEIEPLLVPVSPNSPKIQSLPPNTAFIGEWFSFPNRQDATISYYHAHGTISTLTGQTAPVFPSSGMGFDSGNLNTVGPGVTSYYDDAARFSEARVPRGFLALPTNNSDAVRNAWTAANNIMMTGHTIPLITFDPMPINTSIVSYHG